jgi:hypothetical protein
MRQITHVGGAISRFKVLRDTCAGTHFVRKNRTCDRVSYHCHPKGNCPLADVATKVDLRLDVPRSEVSSPILDHDHVSLSHRIAILVTADVAGVALIGFFIFRLYASPLNYGGLASPVFSSAGYWPRGRRISTAEKYCFPGLECTASMG